MMRKTGLFMTTAMLVTLCVTLCVTFFLSAVCFAEGTEEMLDAANNSKEAVERSVKEFTGSDPDELINAEAGDVFDRLIQILFGEIKTGMKVLLEILAISIVYNIIRTISSGSDSSTGSGASGMACVICTVLTALAVMRCVTEVLDGAKTIIVTVMEFIEATFPAIVTIAAVSGNGITAATVSPMLVFGADLCTGLINTIVFPALALSIAFAAVETISNGRTLKGVSAFIRKACYWTIGTMSAVFTAITAVKGVIGHSTALGGSGLAKYALKFIPVVGDMISDSFQTIIGSLSVIKSISGTLVIVGMIMIAAVPVVKYLTTGFICNAGGMIAECLDFSAGAVFIREAGKTIVAAAAMVLVVEVMFLIVVAFVAY